MKNDDLKEKLILPEDQSDDDEDIDIISQEKSSVSYVGVSLIICSAFFYSISSLTVKLMLDVDPMELVMFRYLGLFIFTLPITIYNRESLFPRNWKDNFYLCLHSFAGAAGGMLSFYAFRHMPLGDSSALCFSTPLFVAVLSVIFFTETFNSFTWFVVSMTFIGVVLISKPESLFGVPTDHPFETWAAVSAVAAAFCKANSFISLRLTNKLHFSVVICHFGLVGFTSSGVIALVSNHFCIPSTITDRLILVGLAILGFLGQMILTIASKTEKPATMSICRSTDIVFAFLYQIFIFHHVPDFYSAVGAILIVTSVFLIKLKPKDK